MRRSGDFSDFKARIHLIGFRYAGHPIGRVRQFHTGIDLPQVKGTPVYATGNGIVSRKGYDTGHGYFIEIQRAGGFRCVYAHLSKTQVNVGDWVSVAKQIGCVGNTGLWRGSHLHYEIRKGNRFLNPRERCYCLFNVFKTNYKAKILIFALVQINSL